MEKKELKIGIIGVGVLGGTLKKYFLENGYEVRCYDKFKSEEGTIEDVNQSDIVFVCVPTSRGQNNKCDISIVEEAMNYIKGKYKIIVIKSTVTPGTTDYLQHKYPKFPIVFNPEFLTAARAYADFCSPSVQIVGYTPRSESVSGVILGILPKAPYMQSMLASAAELYKLYRNCVLLIQNVVTNEFYDLCVAAGINYNLIKTIAEHDPWIGRGHLTPIVNDIRGCNGACIPKDSEGVQAWSRGLSVILSVLDTAIKSNSERLASQGIEKDS